MSGANMDANCKKGSDSEDNVNTSGTFWACIYGLCATTNLLYSINAPDSVLYLYIYVLIGSIGLMHWYYVKQATEKKAQTKLKEEELKKENDRDKAEKKELEKEKEKIRIQLEIEKADRKQEEDGRAFKRMLIQWWESTKEFKRIADEIAKSQDKHWILKNGLHFAGGCYRLLKKSYGSKPPINPKIQEALEVVGTLTCDFAVNMADSKLRSGIQEANMVTKETHIFYRNLINLMKKYQRSFDKYLSLTSGRNVSGAKDRKEILLSIIGMVTGIIYADPLKESDSLDKAEKKLRAIAKKIERKIPPVDEILKQVSREVVG